MTTKIQLRTAAWLLAGLALLAAIVLLARSQSTHAGSNDYVLADKPLYVGGAEPPLMMLVASRDEQLFDKAYGDYSARTAGGVIDTTYNNSLQYEGYFDPFLCYAYSSGVFSAGAARNTDHKCGGSGWSGNFLNWVTMTRVDILRYVLYGGNRSEDTATRTVLERAHIPNDMHAWTKVYTGSDIQQYVGMTVSGDTMTFCNASLAVDGPPLMRVASGRFSSWGVTELNQCLTKNNTDGDGDRPASVAQDFNVRVEVCKSSAAPTGRESFCTRYGNTYKPTGLLQEYGESGRLRFGLISGSYSKPRAGGVLRKNIGLFAGNGTDPNQCAAGDEVKLSDGTFCNQTDNAEGIVNALRRFKIVGWTGTGNDSAWDGSTWGGDCGSFGAGNRSEMPGGGGMLIDPGNGTWKCSPWGNPIAEMYAEAVRYLSGETAPTSNFVESAVTDMRAGRPAWVDPYGSARTGTYGGGNSYCANCSIVILSSGTNSYDGEVPAVSALNAAAEAATQAVGNTEQITNRSFFVGSAGAPDATNLALSHRFVCTSAVIGNLAYVRGICDDAPQREGTYLVSGLSKAAFESDVRASNLPAKPNGTRINVTTYAVELADSLPKIEVRTGTGVLNLTPYCMANPTDPFKRSCQLGDTLAGKQLSVGGSRHIYGRDMAANGTAGSYMFSWDGAPQGEANDRDFVYMLTYCVGSACLADTNPNNNGQYRGYDICWGSQSPDCAADGRPSLGTNDVLVRTEYIGVSSGNPVRAGFSISGAGSLSGLYDNIYRPAPPSCCSGGATYNLLNGSTPSAQYPMDDPVNGVWERPAVVKFTASGASGSMKSPLWYAAKYGGGLQDLNSNGRPDWDDDGDGEPDNYLKARDPSQLKQQLGKLIADAAGAAPVIGGGTSGARLSANGSSTISASFNVPKGSNDWTGNVTSNAINADGSLGAQRWSASSVLNGANRIIRTVMTPTVLNASGGKQADAVVKDFTEENLRTINPTLTVRAKLGLTASDASWLGTSTDADLVSYLRGTTNALPFRVRSSLLGDIINSSVELSTAKDDFGYSAWSSYTTPSWKKTLGDSYTAFLTTKRTVSRNTAFVGANDGMLHAFAFANGREIFGFIPSSARERMGQLANPNYRHQYTMDGEIVSSDVPDASGQWRTLLVASSGAGGKSVSALNVNNPSQFNDASVLWELRGTEGTHPVLDDLGYVLGRPSIVPMTSATAGGAPRWVALFGNGVNSRNGSPVLFVVDVYTGAVLARLKPSGTQYQARNGLVSISPIALYNNDGVVDTVYGGDLQGNVWKFDLSSVSASSWNVAFSGAPLFTARDAAGNPQPITGGLEVSRGPGSGTAIFFGTGKYFAVGDNIVPPNPQVQSLYGIFDRCVSPSCTENITNGRGSLGERKITSGGLSNGYLTRGISIGDAGAKGWFVDLRVDQGTALGERFIGMPRLQNGKVFFTTFEPIGNDCIPGVRNWLYGLDLMSGSGAMAGVSTQPGGNPVCSSNCGGLALEGAQGAPVKDTDILLPQPTGTQLVGCGTNDPNCGNQTALNDALAAKQCSLVLRSEGSDKPLYMPRPCGRQSWRQVR